MSGGGVISTTCQPSSLPLTSPHLPDGERREERRRRRMSRSLTHPLATKARHKPTTPLPLQHNHHHQHQQEWKLENPTMHTHCSTQAAFRVTVKRPVSLAAVAYTGIKTDGSRKWCTVRPASPRVQCQYYGETDIMRELICRLSMYIASRWCASNAKHLIGGLEAGGIGWRAIFF